jgi:hypothetical protein
MISRQRAFDLMKWSRSTYQSMLESQEIADVANAEVYRLCALAWQDITAVMSNTDINDLDLAIEDVIDRMLKEWASYIRTGVATDDTAEATKRVQMEMLANFRKTLPPESQPKKVKEAPKSDEEKAKEKAERERIAALKAAIRPDAIKVIEQAIRQETEVGYVAEEVAPVAVSADEPMRRI